jgi:molecular chaperone GrpE
LGEVGEAFDPHRHQAIAQEPTDQHPAGIVTQVARYGYQLHDRVVRPAEVLVSTAIPPPSSTPDKTK